MRAPFDPGRFSSLGLSLLIAAIIALQALFTFSAVVEARRLVALTVARNAAAREYRTLEGLLYRHRLAERSYVVKADPIFTGMRASAFTAFRSRIAHLRTIAAPAHKTELETLEAEMARYRRAGSRAMQLAASGDGEAARRADEREVQPLYGKLSEHLTASVRDFDERTARLDTSALRRQLLVQYGAAGVLTAGLGVTGGLLAVLERYRRRAERGMAARIAALQASLHSDVLTGLPNERAFHERMAKAAADAVALLVLDIDDFKAVNDARGAAYGDDLLVRLASELNAHARGADVYRLGGDRFALLWDGAHAGESARSAQAARLRASSALGGITVSGGYSEPDPGGGEAPLLEQASSALRAAKAKGGNAFVDFRDVAAGAFILSRANAQAVRRILGESRMPMVFQPIIDSRTGETIAYEALARPDPSHGLRGPEEMFDVAERLYKHVELDRICVSSALRRASKNYAGAPVFVNVVPASLESERVDFLHCVRDLAGVGLSPENVVFEMTERKIGNPAMLAARIDELRALGFRVALDDTGAGYAGLDVLSKMTFDFVKIDRSLTVRAMSDERARGVLSGILAIAQTTGATVIAEGIESEDMYAFARAFHVRSEAAPIGAMQGYLFGRPAPNMPASLSGPGDVV